MLDWDPNAIPVPYNHSNLDSDEVLYYVEGNYKARKGIEQGSITSHPQGIPHGPHPGTIEKSIGATYTNELAVMCDTFRPLYPTKAALGIDDPNYPNSWQGDHFPMAHGNGADGTSGLANPPLNQPSEILRARSVNVWGD
jgi:homogentisate 1,2-dioxygenase